MGNLTKHSCLIHYSSTSRDRRKHSLQGPFSVSSAAFGFLHTHTHEHYVLENARNANQAEALPGMLSVNHNRHS